MKGKMVIDMKTIRDLRSVLSGFFKDNSVKVVVIIQNKRTVDNNDTVGEAVLDLDAACSIFGNYEMLFNRISIYEKTYDVLGEVHKNVMPCIKCGIYVPQNNPDNEEKICETVRVRNRALEKTFSDILDCDLSDIYILFDPEVKIPVGDIITKYVGREGELPTWNDIYYEAMFNFAVEHHLKMGFDINICTNLSSDTHIYVSENLNNKYIEDIKALFNMNVEIMDDENMSKIRKSPNNKWTCEKVLERLESIKDFCKIQSKKPNQSDCAGFESIETGQWIVNPFRDTTGRYEVNPLDEYSIKELLEFLKNYDTRK